MAYDVSNLSVYTQPNEKTVLVKTVLAPKTVALIKAKGKVMTGVKSKSQLPSLDTDAVLQDGKGCGFTPSGTTKISTREVEVGPIKVEEALCPADFETSFEQANLLAGSDHTEAIFANEYVDLKSAKIAKALEVLVWQGDKASANVQLKRIDGFIKIIDAASGVIDGNTGNIAVATGIIPANVRTILRNVRKAMPVEVRNSESEDGVILVGQEILDMYLDALVDANLFHYKPDDQPVGEAFLYGTRTKIIAVPGLNGTNRIYGIALSNMVFATDLLEEAEKTTLEYAKEADEVRFKSKFKAGVQVGFPEEIVQFKLKP